MAAFFANIQVQSSDHAAVVAAVDALFANAGYERSSEAYGGDRSIYVGPVENGWVGVFDSACTGMSVGPLAWLAQGLSAQLQTVTLAWLVHDSALLLYLLFEDGEVQDRYVSHAEYFAAAAQPGQQPHTGPLGGNGERLLALTGADGDGKAVTRWLQQPSRFVERTLRRVAGVLGQPHADLGHGDIEADVLAEAHLEDPDHFDRLEYVSTAVDEADAG